MGSRDERGWALMSHMIKLRRDTLEGIYVFNTAGRFVRR